MLKILKKKTYEEMVKKDRLHDKIVEDIKAHLETYYEAKITELIEMQEEEVKKLKEELRIEEQKRIKLANKQKEDSIARRKKWLNGYPDEKYEG